jgi:hypothetical protein
VEVFEFLFEACLSGDQAFYGTGHVTFGATPHL